MLPWPGAQHNKDAQCCGGCFLIVFPLGTHHIGSQHHCSVFVVNSVGTITAIVLVFFFDIIDDVVFVLLVLSFLVRGQQFFVAGGGRQQSGAISPPHPCHDSGHVEPCLCVVCVVLMHAMAKAQANGSRSIVTTGETREKYIINILADITVQDLK